MNRHAHPSSYGLLRRLWWTSLLATLFLVLAACASSDDVRGTRPGAAPTGGGASSSSQSPRPLTYVALGDSYTSAPFVPVTDVANGCLRSTANYPSLVAKKLDAELDDRSCGAARTADFTRSQHPGVPPQLSAVTKDTDLVTIGIGGNDEGVFTRLITECPRLRAADPTGAPCQEQMGAGGRDVLLAALGRTPARIQALVAQVRRRAPGAEVLLVGYPRIVAAGSTCEKLPLAAGDYPYVERVNRALTNAVRKAARASGSTYVDVWAASLGHDICSSDPWINGSVTDQKRAAAYHPFAVEQAAVADLVVAASSW